MGFIRSFEGVRPPIRYDGEPFTEVDVEESALEAGPFAVVATIELDPLDADPTQPQSRNLTVDTATLETGWYRLVWRDAEADTFTTAPTLYAVGTEAWRPTLVQIAAFLHARTYVDGEDVMGGDEAGTFTDETRPTANQVNEIIDQAADDVVSLFASGEVPVSSYDAARRATALKTALFIELSYFPEQAQDSSPYLQLRALHDAAIATLITGAQVRDLFGENYPVVTS